MKTFEYRYQVGFEDTNLVGNVYYVNHLRWQGRCREMFLREKAPEILEELRRDLALATVRCSCDYLAELEAFDQILLRMRLGAIAQNRMTMLFDYFRIHPNGTEELIARGEQQIACMRRDGAKTVPTPIPASLREALRPYEG